MLMSVFITITAKHLQIIYFNHSSKTKKSFKLLSWIVTQITLKLENGFEIIIQNFWRKKQKPQT